MIEAPAEVPVEALEDELIVPSSSPFALDAGKYPTLAKLGRNLTELASLGRIDEVIGRDDEIERLLDVLARRRSNNPILVGPPGVGKTAIAEGLAPKVGAWRRRCARSRRHHPRRAFRWRAGFRYRGAWCAFGADAPAPVRGETGQRQDRALHR